MADRDPYPSEKQDRFIVRLPDGMRDRIKATAEANNRSMNAEIVATLEERFPSEDPTIYLLNRYHSLADMLLKGKVHPSHMKAIKEEMDDLYKSLISRRDRDYPFGPPRADGTSKPAKVKYKIADLKKRFDRFCNEMDAGRDQAKEEVIEMLASMLTALQSK